MSLSIGSGRCILHGPLQQIFHLGPPSDALSTYQGCIQSRTALRHWLLIMLFLCAALPHSSCPGVEYESRNVLQDPDLREGIKQFTSWPTIPQVFVKGEFVGGCDLLLSMHDSGELKKIFPEDLEKQGK